VEKSIPRPARVFTALKAHMRLGDDMSEITIVNCSESGLLAKCDAPPAVGDEVEIRRRGVTIVGTVVWSERRRFGVRAYQPIDIASLTCKSELQPGRRQVEREPSTSRRLSARWLLWNPLA
jgi:hypothetical protein